MIVQILPYHAFTIYLKNYISNLNVPIFLLYPLGLIPPELLKSKPMRQITHNTHGKIALCKLKSLSSIKDFYEIKIYAAMISFTRKWSREPQWKTQMTTCLNPKSAKFEHMYQKTIVEKTSTYSQIKEITAFLKQLIMMFSQNKSLKLLRSFTE